MIDREKVIKGLVCCREMNNPPGYRMTGCHECPYHDPTHEKNCVIELKNDAITLLKKSFTPEEVYKTVIEHGQHDKRFKLGDKIDYSFMDVVGILNTELMCEAGDM